MNNILLIMPDFFSTKSDIVSALESNGYNVVSYSDRPSKSNFIKSLIRINRLFVALRTKRYIRRIVRENKEKHFYRIIVINGQSFTVNHVKYLLKNVNHDKSVFYMWDALSFLPYNEKLIKLFNYSITFNIHDYRSKKFDFFLPLYISNEYSKPFINNEYKWDLSFVGTGKPKKIEFLRYAIKYCRENNLKALFYIYLPSKLMFIYNKIFCKEYKGLKKDFFKFDKLSHDEIKNIYSQSRCILDSGNENEGGLSLRVFEILGLNKKLILTNKNIENYIFYRKEQFLISCKEIEIEKNFLDSPLATNKNIELYKINNWVRLLIDPQNINIKNILKS